MESTEQFHCFPLQTERVCAKSPVFVTGVRTHWFIRAHTYTLTNASVHAHRHTDAKLLLASSLPLTTFIASVYICANYLCFSYYLHNPEQFLHIVFCTYINQDSFSYLLYHTHKKQINGWLWFNPQVCAAVNWYQTFWFPLWHTDQPYHQTRISILDNSDQSWIMFSDKDFITLLSSVSSHGNYGVWLQIGKDCG